MQQQKIQTNNGQQNDDKLSQQYLQTQPIQSIQCQQTYKSFLSFSTRIMTLCLSSFYFGYTLAYLGSFNYSTIVKVFHIDHNQGSTQGFLQGIVTVGGGFGALISSLFLKCFSRRNSVVCVNFVALLCGVLVLVPDLSLFFGVRFMQGTCIGLYSAIIPLLIKEYSPTEISAVFGAFNQIFITIGVFLPFALQLILVQSCPQQDHWRLMFGVPLLTIIIQTLLLLLVYREQTPKYLLQEGRENECIQFLKQNYKQSQIQKILQQKKSSMSSMSSMSPISHHPQIPRSRSLEHGRVLRTMTAIHLSVLQQFVGINAVVAYGVDIVAQILPAFARIVPVVLNLEGIVAAVVSSLLLVRFGRRNILLVGTAVSAGSLVLISIGFYLNAKDQISNILIICGLIVFMANFGLSLGPVTWLYIAEIVDPDIIPFSTMSNWIASSIVMISFPIITGILGSSVPLFIFFAVWSSGSYLVSRRLLIQTKGKTEKQIKQQFAQS